MEHRTLVLFGIGGIIALIVAMSLVGLGDNLTYYLYPTEAVDQRSDFPDGERFRLAGAVVEGSLSEEGDDLLFDVTDGGETIPVRLTDTPPPLFDDTVPVLLDGAWDGNTYIATNALIRHDENYVVPEEGTRVEGS
ncbi:MAG TPA: cytochrome c maturation protein CcmE [Acidimicrobiia bacterium]|nr:cytochrome c maturation protein CcmE [Acidimicrobiia bacterium]